MQRWAARLNDDADAAKLAKTIPEERLLRKFLTQKATMPKVTIDNREVEGPAGGDAS